MNEIELALRNMMPENMIVVRHGDTIYKVDPRIADPLKGAKTIKLKAIRWRKSLSIRCRIGLRLEELGKRLIEGKR